MAITPETLAARPARYLEWGPVLAGAIGAAAISFVLYAFGSALGLMAVSPHPYRGLSGTSFLIIAAIFGCLVQIVSYAAGGYLAGRMRTPWRDGTEDEQAFRDGAHGFTVWAVGLVFTAAVLASGAGGLLKTASETGAVVAAGAAGGAAANPAARLSLDPADFAADSLTRPAPAPAAGAAAGNRPGTEREPIVRIFTRALRDNALPTEDRTYLAELVARQGGVPQADAEKRVDQAFSQAQAATAQARAAADKARKITMIGAFVTVSTLAIALAAACAAASLGAVDRDKRTAAYWMGARRFW